METESTNKKNDERIAIFEEFFERIWVDGSFVHWVNPKTQKLHVKKVCEEVLGITDTSIFSRWAKRFRDDFNRDYKIWRQQNGDLPTACDKDGQFSLALEEEPPDARLEGFMSSQSVRALGEIDEDALKSVLNAYQTLSCERFLVQIDTLQKRIKELEATVSRKDKKIALQDETIEFIKTAQPIEEEHFMGSVRNLYSYETEVDEEGL